MKQTLLSHLVLGAIAGLAATGAYAGQIQASSVSIAREVITTDVQTVISPSIAYRFFGDVDARVQSQTFQVQFTLAAGEWAVAPGPTALSITDGVSAVIANQQAATDGAYTVDAIALSPDNKTVFATITVSHLAAGVLIKQPIIALNVTSNTIAGVAAVNVSAARGTVTKLYTIAGDLVTDYNATGICQNVHTLAVSFKHYVALMAPATLATDVNATADEHTRAGSTNNATLITFPTNLLVNVTKATGGVGLVSPGNWTFASTAAGTAWVDATNVLLGTVAMTQNSTAGYDSDLINKYLLTGNAAGTGVKAAATATLINGNVEAKDLKVTVSATQGFVVGGTLALNTAATCGAGTRLATTGTVPIVAGNAAGPIDLVLAQAQVNATLGVNGVTPVYVCYTAPGGVTIPSSAFSAVARLEKSAAGANLNEQDNICNGLYIALAGGLKIDVRNYSSSVETSGWESIIRLINNSDASTADVWAQIIHQDGKLGAWGQIATLGPRASTNLMAHQLEALLINAANAGAANNGANAPTAQPRTATTSDTAPRLRITSQSGTSLRVQNYMYNAATGQIIEVSGAQAVDYEGNNVQRAPVSDGQYISQDANSGLNLAP